MADVNKVDDGGHAYPVCFEGGKNSGEQPYFHEGMSLRDHFAGQALVGLGTWMPLGFVNLNTDEACSRRAEWAYAQADAMIAARKGGAA